MHPAEAAAIFEADLQTQQVCQVILARFQCRQLLAAHRYRGAGHGCSLVAITHAFEPRNHALAMQATVLHPPFPPRAVGFQQPRAVLDDSFRRFGPGLQFHPALDAERRRDLAENDAPRFSFGHGAVGRRNQTATLCSLSRYCTRSEGCAPFDSQCLMRSAFTRSTSSWLAASGL